MEPWELVLVVIVAIAIIILVPHAVIWAINTLFGLVLAHSVENWVATAVLLAAVNASPGGSKK
jgi:hypothetical protein